MLFLLAGCTDRSPRDDTGSEDTADTSDSGDTDIDTGDTGDTDTGDIDTGDIDTGDTDTGDTDTGDTGSACDTSPNCDDGNACTDDACNPASGCTHTDNTAACDDGSACTTGDTCDAGECVGGTPPDCDDEDVCTDDSCVPATGCVNDDNTEACDDGSACTTGDTCDAGECAGVTLDCNDVNACTTDSCNNATGCVNATPAHKCDDNSLCTADSCIPASGSCVNTPTVTCDALDQCHVAGSCVPATGLCTNPNKVSMVVTVNNCCTPHAGAGCDYAPINSCVAAAVAPICFNAAGWTDYCVSVAQGYCGGTCTASVSPATCNDGLACTHGDVCTNGDCVATPTDADCNDNNDCTLDSCDPTDGCLHDDLATGTCSDGDACTTGDTCADGVCVTSGEVDCDDENVCTDETCDSGTGQCVIISSDLYTLGNISQGSGSPTGFAGSQQTGTFQSAGLSCPQGSVAVGYEGNIGAWTNRFRLFCKALNSDGTFGALSITPNLLGTSDSTAYFGPLCPDGEVLVDVSGRVGGNFDQLDGRCLTLDEVVGLASPGTGTVLGPVGNPNGGSPFDLPCPPGSAVYGFEGWADVYPHRMRFYCGEITRDVETCDDGEVCTDDDTCLDSVCQSGTPNPTCEAACAEDDDNDPDDAATLTAGVPAEGAICEDDTDWFKAPLGALCRGDLVLSFDETDDNLDLKVWVGVAGTLIYDFDSETDEEHSFYVNRTSNPVDLYAEVRGSGSGLAEYAFDFDKDCTCAAIDDGNEPDSIGNPLPLPGFIVDPNEPFPPPPPNPMQGHLCGADSDFFRIFATPECENEVTLVTDHDIGNLDLYGYDAITGAPDLTSATANDTESLIVPTPGGPQQWWFEVRGDANNVSTPYTIVHTCTFEETCTPELPPNDWHFSATPLQFTPPALPTTGQICAFDQDWFSMSVDAGCDVIVMLTFTNEDADLDLLLLDAGPAPLGQSSGTGNSETVGMHNFLGDTTWYAQVLPKDPSTPGPGDYTLQAILMNCPPP